MQKMLKFLTRAQYNYVQVLIVRTKVFDMYVIFADEIKIQNSLECIGLDSESSPFSCIKHALKYFY